jgi:transglutaminase-like putative cysteine protease
MDACLSRPSTSLGNVERFFQLSLLGMLASGYFAVASSGFLAWPVQAITLSAFGVRVARIAGWIDTGLGPRAASILTLACIVFYPLDYLYISGILPVATLHLMFLLAVLKLVTAVTDRDYAYLKMIAALELMVAAVLSTTLGFFVYLTLFLLFAISTYASGEVRQAAMQSNAPVRAGFRSFGRRLGLVSVVLCAGILTLTAGMFFVLPRTARAAMSRFGAGRYHLPGFTSEITLGEFGEIKQSNRAVMHVRAYGGEALTQVRWRGAALSQFDGTRWFAPSAPEVSLRVEHGIAVLGRAPRSRPGRTVAYRVQLDEIAADTLFFAGTPETININLRELWISRGGSYRVPRLPNGITYSVYGFIEDESARPAIAAPPLGEIVRRETLRLPDLDRRIPRLAEDMAAGAQSDEERARLIERRLRHDYAYTLQLPRAPVSDPLANFLFVRRKGHCEYFASAMAVMLRTLGIPSRVVTGFQSGVFNPLTGSQLVRASDAHSWVEAWIPASGWTTFDPTPADPNAGSAGVAGKISMYFDAADQFWQEWVLSYDMQRQYSLAARMQESGRSLHMPWFSRLGTWSTLLSGLSGTGVRLAISAVCTAILVIFLWPTLKGRWHHRARLRRAQRGEAHTSDATMLYQRMLTVLERRGLHKPAWQTPAEFARCIPESDMSLLVEDLTHAYNEFRFGGHPNVAPRMIRLLGRLESLPR